MASLDHFWRKWRHWFDQRSVTAAGGGLKVVYVTEDTGLGGGHRVVFHHLNGLKARGHDVELYTLDGPPDWFDLEVPVRTFTRYEELRAALAPLEAVKVATWWNTAAPVWRASVRRGIPVYFVQDIETSYYPDPESHGEVLDSYRHEFRYVTTSGWVAERLREMHVDPTIVPPGVDLGTFHPLGRERHERSMLALARSNPLKDFDLTRRAYEALPAPRPELWLFGIEPELADDLAAHYHEAPTDGEINELLNTATTFVQTSRHEGFCLPILEAMATGVPVVCTDADGNRDFCRDGENCLMPEATPQAVRDAIRRVLEEAELRERLASEGMETARRYAWEAQLDALERFYQSIVP
jgi:glycosyltransferase involved in cell wall biosynthesis